MRVRNGSRGTGGCRRSSGCLGSNCCSGATKDAAGEVAAWVFTVAKDGVIGRESTVTSESKRIQEACEQLHAGSLKALPELHERQATRCGGRPAGRFDCAGFARADCGERGAMLRLNRLGGTLSHALTHSLTHTHRQTGRRQTHKRLERKKQKQKTEVVGAHATTTKHTQRAQRKQKHTQKRASRPTTTKEV